MRETTPDGMEMSALGGIDVLARTAARSAVGDGLQLVDWQHLPPTVDIAQAGTQAFASLRCRGFSYAFSTAPRFRLPFAQRVNLRFALHLPKTLSHPPSVVRALRRDRCRHVVSADGRCAGFALGNARRDVDGIGWYIYALQSDLALHGRAAIRDYLRGWRKVLTACVLNRARTEGVTTVNLAPSGAVFETAQLNRAYRLTRVPDIWRQIYDRTARDFGMELVDVGRALNIQATPRRRAHACRMFYRLRVS
jgi:hypothetical protein